MKIIVVGCGKTGYTIAKVLSEKKGIDVTVVDKNPDVLDDSTEPIDVIFTAGNGANDKTLIEAGARDADLIICTTNADETNILCCIMARHLGAKRTMARLRDPDYSMEFNSLWRSLGIDMVINPERQTASEISRLLRYPAADDVTDTFAGGRVELVSLRVSETPEYFTGKSVQQIFDRKMGILLAVIERDEKTYIPSGDFVFEKSDIIRILGRPSQVMRFLTSLSKTPKTQEVMVIGGGRITRYLMELLSRHTQRMNVRIIEKDRQTCEQLSETVSEINRRCMVIHGDGTNEELLLAEEIDAMNAFVCLMDRDEENAIISLHALRMGVKRVITKINYMRQNMISNLGLEFGTMITPQNITARIVVKYVDGLTGAIGSNIKAMHTIFTGDDGDVEAVELLVAKKCKCLDSQIKDLKIKKGILIGYVSREAEIIIPSGETQLQLGDSVIIISKNHVIRDLDDILMNRTEASEEASEAASAEA